MTTINQFFVDLNSNIRNARTKKALKLLNKRGKVFIRNLNITKEKRIAHSKFKTSKKLIKIRAKSLC